MFPKYIRQIAKMSGYVQISEFFQNIFRTKLSTDMYLAQLNVVTKTHEKTFERYKNIYSGKDITIIATGPSLNKYKPLKDTINIAIKRAINLDNINFDYLFSIDYNNVEAYLDSIKTKQEVKKFFGILPLHTYGYFEQTNEKHIFPESFITKYNASKYYVYSNKPADKVNFNTEIDKTWLVDGGSSTFSAMQFALFTNPKRIYLVGCDCTSGYFNGKGQNDATPFVKVWKKLKKFADIYYPDTEIISINPVGLKGIFKDIYQN